MHDIFPHLTIDCFSKLSNHTQLQGAGASNLQLAVDSSETTQLCLSYWHKQQSRGEGL